MSWWLKAIGKGTSDRSEYLNGEVALRSCNLDDQSQVFSVRSVAKEFAQDRHNFAYKFAS